MLRTPLCDLLGIEYPIVQGAIWPATSPELVAAVSNAGALGSIGAIFASAEQLRPQIERVRQLTDRPFAVNHVVPMLNEEAFALTIAAKPAVISFALGDPGDLVARAHESGAKVIHQVHTAQQARQAAQRGVDAIIAQGGEAGGQGLVQGPSTMVLVPQVVDAVDPIPVLAAGGIADGRGLAAALVLGAQGANIGTRFLASHESSAPEVWKQAILSTESEDAVRFEVWEKIMPAAGDAAYDTVPRVLRTAFVDAWRDRPDDAKREAERLRGEIMQALREGRAHELVPFSGQTAGLVREILPAAEIVNRIVRDAEQALRAGARLATT
ncbi:MAG: NAD(P)H-dependent flavin oxidoreductase [Thermomicrobiales bacterium]